MKALLLLISLLLISISKYEPDTQASESTATKEQVIREKLRITGDFNGDGKPESLKERYVHSTSHAEIELPDPDKIEYDSLVSLAVSSHPKVYLQSNDDEIPNLHMAHGGQLFGLCWLKNEGDINGDGADEISLVLDWADWSNLNTCRIFSLKNNQWKQIGSFSIGEWQMYPSEDECLFEGFIHQDTLGNFYVETYDWEAGLVVQKELQLDK
ncbi:MAG: hypothetical protein AAGI38_15955 [Bacteroidota bacterium]